MTLHTKNGFCRSNGVTCGQYKDKEEKTKKALNIKKENFEKTENSFFSHSPKEHIFKKLGC